VTCGAEKKCSHVALTTLLLSNYGNENFAQLIYPEIQSPDGLIVINNIPSKKKGSRVRNGEQKKNGIIKIKKLL